MEDKNTKETEDQATEEKTPFFDSLGIGVFVILAMIGTGVVINKWSTRTLQLNHEEGVATVVHSKWWGMKKTEKSYSYNESLKEWFAESKDGKLVSVRKPKTSNVKL
jgi:hypothetical protein